MQEIEVLGTKYTIEYKTKEEDSFLNESDGYCDKTVHKIVICQKESDCQLEDFERYQRQVLRHEIIHAFHFESGLAENLECRPYGFPETLVDWFAIMYPRISKVFEELGIKD